VARAQAGWIAALEPWRGLGYTPGGLGRYLARKARARGVLVAREGRSAPLGVAVVDDGVLLGGFIALLAVRPEAGGRGVGRALVERARAQVARKRRWLYVSADGNNRAALRFYRRLGFLRVGRLPDLVRAGRVEVLLRRATGDPLGERAAQAKSPAGPRRLGYHRGAP
jgi:ribosomal protein S18 acetylase RimI-like enzyme